ncbi:MAG: MarR family transcriptional regulator [Pseudomonadota bacterium]
MDQKPFEFFNEIGIIAQLSRALFEARLPNGLLVTHFSVLNHLIRVRDGQTPLAIARAFQTPKTSMTHTLAGLEKHGLIEMRPNPDDGRSKQVWITQAGQAFRNDAMMTMAQSVGSLLSDMPSSYFDEMVPKLRDMRVLLDENRD